MSVSNPVPRNDENVGAPKLDVSVDPPIGLAGDADADTPYELQEATLRNPGAQEHRPDRHRVDVIYRFGFLRVDADAGDARIRVEPTEVVEQSTKRALVSEVGNSERAEDRDA